MCMQVAKCICILQYVLAIIVLAVNKVKRSGWGYSVVSCMLQLNATADS